MSETVTTWLYAAYDADGKLVGELRGTWSLQNNTVSAFDAFNYHYGVTPSSIKRVNKSAKTCRRLRYPGNESWRG